MDEVTLIDGRLVNALTPAGMDTLRGQLDAAILMYAARKRLDDLAGAYRAEAAKIRLEVEALFDERVSQSPAGRAFNEAQAEYDAKRLESERLDAIPLERIKR